MKKLLWIGDAGCPSGFARATHEILDVLRATYDVTVLGLNYMGDPHAYPYPIYSCFPGGDMFGVGRLPWMCATVKPDVIVIQNDPWNIPAYMQTLAQLADYKNVPVIVACAIDGKNVRGEWLNDIAHAVFWTQFALDEAKAGGYAGPAAVIPLGVDTSVYYPVDQREARMRHVPDLIDNFIVGNINRNQPRKRWDLTIRYFAEWVKAKKIDDAYLYLHVAPTGDMGVDVKQLCQYYGIIERLALMEPPTFYGISEERMRDTYNCFDVQVSTSQGEGLGLTTLEGMACGIPQIVPNYAGLGEICKDAAWMVPCTSTAINTVAPRLNIVGGVADEALFIAALSALYNNRSYRETNGKAALERASLPRYRWTNIGAEWLKVVDLVCSQKWQEVA